MGPDVLSACVKKGAIVSSEKTEQAAADSLTGTYSYLTEEEKRVNDDYEWCLHDPEVRRQYGEQVVAAYQRRIWGAGANHSAAVNAALQQPGCPPRRFFALVVVPPLIPTPSDPPSAEE